MARKNDIFAVINGITDNATITGTGAADTITVTANNVTVNAGGGGDTVSTTITNRTDDLFIYQNGELGADILSANVNAGARYLGSVLNGGIGGDTITTNTTLSNGFSDTLLESYAVGGDGADTINMTAALNGGGNLWQEAYGGTGGDNITMNASTTGGVGTVAYNYVEAGAGIDTVTATIQGAAGSTVYNEIYGGDVAGLNLGTDDTLTGIVIGEGSSFIYGQSGNDILRATGGNNNELYGMDGNDTLYGSTGVDYFVGGAGIDTFVLGSGGEDVIVDFDTGLLGTFIGADIIAFEPGTNLSLVDVIVGGDGLLEITLAGNTVVQLAGTDASLLGQLEGILGLLGIGSPVAGEVG
ncbi:hypothetical protein PK98_03045 [Croceibacterium mercuriale]|uniref:Calcium-binding protein n=1 Tax=Croceibacterium mercuriale TaxID=1572751 RepID=A0A0B2C0F6_9SPHN|nr:calcium-binding protein [Croceibacterium mercuriale]KHL25645.1 hypothetical protein PK98_03045 [Croceibacterium mercuriale]